MEAKTIDEAIQLMDEIVDYSIKNSDRTGYFAALYRKVTIRIRDLIKEGVFEDNPRMEKFDVIFANRYLKAYWQWRNGKQTTRVWATTFAATQEWKPLVVQHLFLGMNAHINLDLGIAAARTEPGAAFPTLRNDFNKINEVLGGLVDNVIDELGEIWLPMKLLNLTNADDKLFNFSMGKTRDHAWKLAETLAPLSIADQEDEIRDKDFEFDLIGKLIAHPGIAIEAALLPIRLSERGRVREKIEILAAPANQHSTIKPNLLFNA